MRIGIDKLLGIIVMIDEFSLVECVGLFRSVMPKARLGYRQHSSTQPTDLSIINYFTDLPTGVFTAANWV
jgi:hypothetical protein